MMLLKCCTQYANKFGNLSSGQRTGNAVFIPISKKANNKECSNYHTIALISYDGKLMLKILQAIDFNSTWTEKFQIFKLDLEKAEEPEIKLSTSVGSPKKQECSRKMSTSTLVTPPKTLTVWNTANCGKFFKRGI